MTMTNPTGKQNTFAGQVFPSLMMLECKRDKIPLSYVNAFERPVSAFGGQGIVEKSIDRLIEHVKVMDDVYQLPVLHRVWLVPQLSKALSAKGEVLTSFPAVLDTVSQWTKED
jgi:CRISPR system Cascade subunit CasC